LFDVERKDAFARNVAFPDVGVTLHLADAQGGMKRRTAGAFLEEPESSLGAFFHSLGKLGVGFPEGFGGLESH
jgi:hypothetical protein